MKQNKQKRGLDEFETIPLGWEPRVIVLKMHRGIPYKRHLVQAESDGSRVYIYDQRDCPLSSISMDDMSSSGE
jgi:hypothetical protein